MNKFVLFGAAMLLFTGLTSCHDDDPTVSTEIPTPTVAPNTVSGIITTLEGEPIQNAQVKVGAYTATTNAQGYYLISDVAAGEYAAEASATGMVTATAEVTVAKAANTQSVVWSVALAKEVKETVNVTVAEGGKGTVESDAIKGNTKGEIEMSVDVDANVVPTNTQISITPIYTEESAKIKGRAESETLLIGANVTCSDPNLKLSSPIDVSFAVDQTVVSSVETKQYINGQWQPVAHTTNDKGIVVPTKEFAPIGLFFKVNVTTGSTTEPITFSRSLWDNLYGTAPMRVGEATYTYKVGSDYETRGANTLEALLIEHLARLVGPTSRTLQGIYPLNMVLSIGQAVEISGKQAVENVTVSSSSRSVAAKKYGTVSVTAVGTIRDHNGSGS